MDMPPPRHESYYFYSARFEGYSIWESPESVFEIQRRGSEYRVIMYKKHDEELDFEAVAYYKDPEKLSKLINKLGLEKVAKKLTLRKNPL